MCQYHRFRTRARQPHSNEKLALARKIESIKEKFIKTTAFTKDNFVVTVLTGQFLPFTDRTMTISSRYTAAHFIYILCVERTPERRGIPQRMNWTINCRAPSEIYGWAEWSRRFSFHNPVSGIPKRGRD